MRTVKAYQDQLDRYRSNVLSALKTALTIPLPSDADYAGLYYQPDNRNLFPLTLTWITLDRSCETYQPCPFSQITTQPWEWTSEEIDHGIHEEAEEHLFQWVSDCWHEAGGKNYPHLFVLFDHGSMEILDLNNLEELSDDELNQHLK